MEQKKIVVDLESYLTMDKVEFAEKLQKLEQLIEILCKEKQELKDWFADRSEIIVKRAEATDRENRALKQYITLGGFIPDRNGSWCKDGDIVRITDDASKEGNYELEWDDGYSAFFLVCHEIGDSDYACNYQFELIEPCEPNVCKNFKDEV